MDIGSVDRWVGTSAVWAAGGDLLGQICQGDMTSILAMDVS